MGQHFAGGVAQVRVLQIASVLALAVGCSSTQEDNADRADDFTDLVSSANLTAPSDLSGMQGEAVFNGAAVASFGDFGGTGDARITVNFSDRSLSGNLRNWSDLDPTNYEIDGEVVISNGVIQDGGTFAAQVAGNLERTARGPEPQSPDGSPLIKVFAGTAEGAFYDSTSGSTASHVLGEFESVVVEGTDQSPVSGSFVARR